ncbi:RNI-like protein [Dioscorea alata]|uniref:RNI-like protein n=1 Tax=Dioscorea alata TaxID=55571 RepID=A0ACB7VCM1_DIOAL|nr:RNI-like protein [Dioscorea alata]
MMMASEMADMACASDEDLVLLVLSDPSTSQEEEELMQLETLISASDIRNWNLPLILSSSIIKVEANRSRLMKQSSYFRGLLGGSFSESSLRHVVVQWNLEIIVRILQFIYGLSINVTHDSLLPLLEGGLFFGVEGLLLECESWFHKFTSSTGIDTLEMPLDALVEIWNFGLDHGIGCIQETCEDYLARNFTWTMLSSSFAKIPYDLLWSIIEHSYLTVESEMQLCDALLNWLSINSSFSDCLSVDCGNHYFHILKKVRICLLPLWFAAAKKRCFFEYADKCVTAILYLMENYHTSLLSAVPNGVLDNYRIRLTKYSKKVALSGCPQITVAFLILATLPLENDAALMTRIINSLIELDNGREDCQLFKKSLHILSFISVHELDISKCPKVQFGAAVKWLHLAFPSLRILKASHSVDFEIDHLFYLSRNCCHIHEVDLTVDVSPVIITKVSILSASTDEYGRSKNTGYKFSKEYFATMEKPLLSSVTKLSLEGRNNIDDLDLLNISSLFGSLCYLNIKGCALVTDIGISKLLCKCPNIKSLILSHTSFGRNSVLALCSDNMTSGVSSGDCDHRKSGTMAYHLHQLQINGCKDVDQGSMIKLMSHAYMLKVLCMNETSLVDDALFGFKGCSLEELDVSETKVSMQALAFIMRRNSNVKCLKATGCKNLHQHGSSRTHGVEESHHELLAELGRIPALEEVALGWGFSTMSLDKLETAIGKLRAISLGLGVSLDHNSLSVLPRISPLLERVILTFQVVSDGTVRSLLESLKYLRELQLVCCLGELTSYSFEIGMPMLRVLRLEWVTPWMTNRDLVILTQNCSNLVEFSLSGCKLLDPDSQEIISSGWPGLTVIHLEDCGNITANGVCSFFNCKAVEDLLLRHNGQGIGRNFIVHAASQLPLLRKLALDLCDACDGGFESPSHAERFFLSNVRISCCKSHRCGFEFMEKKAFKPVHKETIVLEWNQKELRTTLVKERI